MDCVSMEGLRMAKLDRLPKELLIMICDSRKALLLRNSGSAINPSLEVLDRVKVPEDDSAAAMPDRPGRRYDGGAMGASFQSRSAMEEPDLARQASEAFADQIIAHLTKVHRRKPIVEMLIAAPPAFLGVLRDRMPGPLAALVTAEIPKHLTDVRIDEIAGSLVEKW